MGVARELNLFFRIGNKRRLDEDGGHVGRTQHGEPRVLDLPFMHRADRLQFANHALRELERVGVGHRLTHLQEHFGEHRIAALQAHAAD